MSKIFIIIVLKLRRERRKVEGKEMRECEKKVRREEGGEQSNYQHISWQTDLSAPCAASYSRSSHRLQSLQVLGLSCLHKNCIQIHSVRVCLSGTLLLLFLLFPSHDFDELLILFLVFSSH